MICLKKGAIKAPFLSVRLLVASPFAFIFREQFLAQADVVRCHFHELVVFDEFQRLFQ